MISRDFGDRDVTSDSFKCQRTRMHTSPSGQLASVALLCCIYSVYPFVPTNSPLLRVSKVLKSVEPARGHREMVLRKATTSLKMGFFDNIIKSVGLPVSKDGAQPVSDAENSKIVEQYMKRVEDRITPLEAKIEKLSDDELKAKTNEFRSRLQVFFMPI